VKIPDYGRAARSWPKARKWPAKKFDLGEPAYESLLLSVTVHPDGRAYGDSEPSGTRTRDPLIKSQMLYRPELTARATKRFKISHLRTEREHLILAARLGVPFRVPWGARVPLSVRANPTPCHSGSEAGKAELIPGDLAPAHPVSPQLGHLVALAAQVSSGCLEPRPSRQCAGGRGSRVPLDRHQNRWLPARQKI
jgi:hypothetical protein